MTQKGLSTFISAASLSSLVEGKLRQYMDALGGDLGGELYNRVMREVERPLFDLALEVCRGNKVRTAALLGISRNTLKRKMGELGLA